MPISLVSPTHLPLLLLLAAPRLAVPADLLIRDVTVVQPATPGPLPHQDVLAVARIVGVHRTEACRAHAGRPWPPASPG